LDDTYQIYINRVVRMTLPETYQSQVQYIQPSPKFYRDGTGAIQPAAFPGYTVISPPWSDDDQNRDFYSHLESYQQHVLQQLEPGLVIAVPAKSFHFTLADLIWAGAYRHAIENPEFETQLHQRVAESFQKSELLIRASKPIYWQVIGLFLRTRAIGVCLVPKDEDSYNRVAALRRMIYQNPNVIGLGIEQQYNFTAHITLGYFGEVAATVDRDQLAEQLIQLNEWWLETGAQEIWVHRAELRKFDDMTHYYREPDWPAVEF
jgi:2'-5' RNA ligase